MSNTDPDSRGIVVSPRTITVILGVISLFTSLYFGVSKVNSYDFRLAQLETDKVQLSSTIAALTNEIKDLNGKIVDLTISLNGIQIRQGLMDKDRGRTDATRGD